MRGPQDGREGENKMSGMKLQYLFLQTLKRWERVCAQVEVAYGGGGIHI